MAANCLPLHLQVTCKAPHPFHKKTCELSQVHSQLFVQETQTVLASAFATCFQLRALASPFSSRSRNWPQDLLELSVRVTVPTCEQTYET